jgi:hypothetical protein
VATAAERTTAALIAFNVFIAFLLKSTPTQSRARKDVPEIQTIVILGGRNTLKNL